MSGKALPPASTLQWLLNVGSALWSEWNGVGCLYIDFSTFMCTDAAPTWMVYDLCKEVLPMLGSQLWLTGEV